MIRKVRWADPKNENDYVVVIQSDTDEETLIEMARQRLSQKFYFDIVEAYPDWTVSVMDVTDKTFLHESCVHFL
jgi:hypothetical protein